MVFCKIDILNEFYWERLCFGVYELFVGHLGSLILSGKGFVFDLVPFIKVKLFVLFRGLVKV